MSNVDFLTADVTKLLSNTEITFSQRGTTDLQKTDLAPGLVYLADFLCKPYLSNKQSHIERPSLV